MNAFKGTKPANINMTQNLTIHAPAGTDAKALAAQIKGGTRRMIKDLMHAAGAGSGNSVGRPLQTGGATRP